MKYEQRKESLPSEKKQLKLQCARDIKETHASHGMCHQSLLMQPRVIVYCKRWLYCLYIVYALTLALNG